VVWFTPLFVVGDFQHDISKPDAAIAELGLPNLTNNSYCFTISSGNPVIFGSRVTQTVPVWLFALSWVLQWFLLNLLWNRAWKYRNMTA